MSDNVSLRSYIKELPVVGPAAKLANRARLLLVDMVMRRDRWKSAGLRMKHEASWYILKNPWSRKRFFGHRQPLPPAQGAFLGDLAANGVASGSVQQGGVDANDFGRLQERVDGFARSAADRVAAATDSYSDALELGSLEHNRERFRRFFRDKDEAKLDDYILKMNAESSVLGFDDPLISIGLSAPILNVVSGYLKLWPKLIYADAWYSIPVDPGKRIGSQRWHRDPEDRQMVKVYLYFSHIDADAGAMEYIVGTSNALGRPGLEIGQWKAAGAHLYPPPELVEETFPATQRFSCSGPVGTLLFCDTTGLHRGGISKAKPRVVATWTFVTPASRYERRFTLRPVAGVELSEEGRFAVDL